MNTSAARLAVLAIMSRWHRNIVWRVQYRLHSGTTEYRWFRREETARKWAEMLMNPEIVEVSYTVRECRQFGFVDDELHWVASP